MVAIHFVPIQKTLTQVVEYLEHLDVLVVADKKFEKSDIRRRPNPRVISLRKETRKRRRGRRD